MAKKVKVLLLKPLPPKGNAGDVIDVKIHYAAHVLIPQGLAIVYDKQVQNQRETQMKRIEKNKAEVHQQVADMVAAIEKAGGITFEKAATENGGLYDSISNKILSQYIEETYGIRLAADCFGLEEKIHELGEYTTPFVYEDLETQFPIHVVAKEEAVA